MLIANIDGSIIGEYWKLFPNTSFPATGPTQAWLEMNGFVKVAKTEEEVAEEVRSERNKLISETDWMALSDNTLTEEWAAYRQALRDITNQEGFPNVVEWPVKPE